MCVCVCVCVFVWFLMYTLDEAMCPTLDEIKGPTVNDVSWKRWDWSGDVVETRLLMPQPP